MFCLIEATRSFVLTKCTVPVFNSAAHFKTDAPETGRLKAEEVVTQRAKVDPTYNSEIPEGSLVAIHSTVSTYTAMRPPKVKTVSFNLLAVQILAFPNDS